MSANFFPQVSHFFIYKNFRRTRDYYPFFIVKGGRLFVKVSGYSLYVYFLLFKTKAVTSVPGGVPPLLLLLFSIVSKKKKKRKMECFAHLD